MKCQSALTKEVLIIVTKSIFSLFLLIFVVQSTSGKTIYKNNEQNLEEEVCLNQLLTHPDTKRYYPNLLEDQNNPQYVSFLHEMESYCGCYQKSVEAKKLELKVTGIAWGFNSTKVRFETADICALEHFSSHALYHNFYINLQTHVRDIIARRLSERLPRGIRTVASGHSLKSRHFCLENKVLNHCSKIKSLGSTYKCVNSTFSQRNKLDRFEKQCPTFRNKGERDISENLRL